MTYNVFDGTLNLAQSQFPPNRWFSGFFTGKKLALLGRRACGFNTSYWLFLNLWSNLTVLYFLSDHPVHSVYRTSNLIGLTLHWALTAAVLIGSLSVSKFVLLACSTVNQRCSQRQRGEANQAMPLIWLTFFLCFLNTGSKNGLNFEFMHHFRWKCHFLDLVHYSVK